MLSKIISDSRSRWPSYLLALAALAGFIRTGLTEGQEVKDRSDASKSVAQQTLERELIRQGKTFETIDDLGRRQQIQLQNVDPDPSPFSSHAEHAIPPGAIARWKLEALIKSDVEIIDFGVYAKLNELIRANPDRGLALMIELSAILGRHRNRIDEFPAPAKERFRTAIVVASEIARITAGDGTAWPDTLAPVENYIFQSNDNRAIDNWIQVELQLGQLWREASAPATVTKPQMAVLREKAVYLLIRSHHSTIEGEPDYLSDIEAKELARKVSLEDDCL